MPSLARESPDVSGWEHMSNSQREPSRRMISQPPALPVRQAPPTRLPTPAHLPARLPPVVRYSTPAVRQPVEPTIEEEPPLLAGCIQSFSPTRADEMQMTRGQIVEVLEMGPDAYWVRQIDSGLEGVVPASHLEEIVDHSQILDLDYRMARGRRLSPQAPVDEEERAPPAKRARHNHPEDHDLQRALAASFEDRGHGGSANSDGGQVRKRKRDDGQRVMTMASVERVGEEYYTQVPGYTAMQERQFAAGFRQGSSRSFTGAPPAYVEEEEEEGE